MDRLACDRMFVSVLDTGSFAAAARRLQTSTGQASRLVARLEADLGVQLLNRTTRALAPTEAGQVYYERMKDLLAEMEALETSVRSQSGLAAGRLRVSAPVTFGTRRLVPLMMRFAADYPAIRLDVQFSDRVVNLLEEGFDLAVRVGMAPDSSLIARRLGETRLITLAAPAYLEARGLPERPEDLAGHDLILDSNMRDPTRWSFRGAEPVGVTGRLRFSNAEACLTAALSGFGITRLPDFVAGEALASGALREVLSEFEPAAIPIHVVWPPGRHLAGKVRALVDALAQDFGRRENPTSSL
ncbi:LysR family transcriptional regulator [Falsigemmobacter intermedius]|uniref:LysR family transcriptional regulator n=1 Tax=Falsigemmobacter intermedius TaxID=1553448 RepID=A0A3S3WUA0_9RHOB|nr:LysR family transcriptional regulator [Falsigemmobacter intermedius]RWY44258.1 LysR family transcriptional regulator [Falsigemmobacter intermedius]